MTTAVWIVLGLLFAAFVVFVIWAYWEDECADQSRGKIPWAEKTAPGRLPPRECIRNARDALNSAYGHEDRVSMPLLLEAVDWLRRGLEQMAPEEA